ncbi:hypothetical protein ANCDUO_05516 [Ancylostoma duodenale]|uniref:Phlebovirus glycoprotein G2 fusion domain-containing protein n=1 Tax=Ancylostoma duodenale TaxID=51022 RepID=A0A0C2GS80_9BILA|nr:hypothetical protein ANCDUO_05516 [Ancylostoma duodenale]
MLRGLYERLIKSVKHSLYKVLQRIVPTQEGLETLLMEIEGCLNTRPLTYQEEKWEDTPILRPIDFMQRDIIISYPFESIQCGEEDANYHPSGEAILLRNRQQAEEALKTSHQLTERFWSLWSQQYLTSLRESPKLQINSKRSTPRLPTKGTVVLISDPVIPRNAWKLGKITDLKPSATGMIREAELQMPNGRKMRRPINLLIPLELSNSEDTCDQEQHDNSGAEEEISGLVQEPVYHRYDLRPNRRLNYREMETGLSRINSTTKSLSRSLVALTLCTLLVPATEATSTITQTPIQGFMQCVQEGIRLTSSTMKRFELCAADCVINKSPAIEETVQLPPEITLHEYAVQWKIFDGDHVTLMETTCPPVPFCENLRCWFCTANVFNPECSPVAAIVTTAVILYVAIALLYAVCYIPLTLGKPFLLMLQGMGLYLTTMFAVGIKLWMWRRDRTQRENRRTRIELLLSIVTLLATVAFTQSCQDVDISQLQTTVCRRSSDKNETCKIDITQFLKMNTFHREACFRITKQGLVIKEIHLEWKRLQLVRDKQMVMFTRHTVQRVIDAKRCPRSGSCTENKCENVNTTTLISELSEGNEFPGLTYCAESCGGPGCGCFYLSSGCLFYRIYATPVNDDIYEIFRCPRWRGQVISQRTVTHLDNSVDESTVVLQPTVPKKLEP